jgi:hypothetical protein
MGIDKPHTCNDTLEFDVGIQVEVCYSMMRLGCTGRKDTNEQCCFHAGAFGDD